MNSISKKLRNLEKNVLPIKPDPATLYVENEAEIELNKKANNIRKNLNFDVIAIWHNDKFTFEQKQNKTFAGYNNFSEKEKQILRKDTDFYERRLQDLLIKYFKAIFPDKSRKPLLRITWFFIEMYKLGVTEYMEDSEWIHNRNEDDPDFDDYEWWDSFEAKVKKEFPEGVFTEKSFEVVRDCFDEKEAEAIREYWQANPEEYKNLLNSLKTQS